MEIKISIRGKEGNDVNFRWRWGLWCPRLYTARGAPAGKVQPDITRCGRWRNCRVLDHAQKTILCNTLRIHIFAVFLSFIFYIRSSNAFCGFLGCSSIRKYLFLPMVFFSWYFIGQLWISTVSEQVHRSNYTHVYGLWRSPEEAQDYFPYRNHGPSIHPTIRTHEISELESVTLRIS